MCLNALTSELCYRPATTTIYCDVVEEFLDIRFPSFSLLFLLIVKKKVTSSTDARKDEMMFYSQSTNWSSLFSDVTQPPGKEITHKYWWGNPQDINLACCCRWRRIVIIIIITSNFVWRWRSEKIWIESVYYIVVIGLFLVDEREDVHQIREIPIVICFQTNCLLCQRLEISYLFCLIAFQFLFFFFSFFDLGFWVAQLPVLPVAKPEMSAGRRETRRTRNCTMEHFGDESHVERNPLKARDDRRIDCVEDDGPSQKINTKSFY